MKVAIKDACVLIDLANGALLEAWFRLGIETRTSDLVLRQVKGEAQWAEVSRFVEAGWIKVDTLNDGQMERMLRELAGMPIGLEDQTALFLAIELNAILLTGDRRLRLEGLKRRVKVRGVLWVLDQLVEHDVLTTGVAAERLQTILEQGAFLPADECKRRLSLWTSRR